MIREILIHVKLGKNEMQSAIQLQGFVEENVVPNILTTMGVIENLKQQEIEKLNKKVPEEEKYVRISIPKSVKLALWKNHFSEQLKGHCFVCNNIIPRDGFEAGHVVSVADGGSNGLENLRPICKECNRSMGTQNLNDFKREFH